MSFKVDGIAFDMGNTLILDPFELVLKSKSFEMKSAFSQAGYSFSAKDIADAWSDANKKINYPFICHFYQEPAIIKHCLDLLKVEKPDKPRLATNLLIIYRSGLKSAVTSDRRIDTIQRVLSGLRRKGKRLVMFGNGRQKTDEVFLSWTGLLEYFHHFAASEKIGIEKPDGRAFNYVLKALGTAPARSMYVGDDMVNDISPAKAAGMLAVLHVPPAQVSTPWRNYDAKTGCKPDAVIRSFAELLEIVK